MDFMGALDQTMANHAERLFDMFDEDKSGYLDFREMVSCLSVLTKGSFEQKLQMLFDIYDIDNSGYLSHEEISKMLET
jgi:Ca2+-binding EF-hand superfamily protein